MLLWTCVSECSHGRLNCAIFFSSVLARRKGSGWRVTVFILLFSTLCHSPCHYLILNLSWVFFHTDVLILMLCCSQVCSQVIQVFRFFSIRFLQEFGDSSLCCTVSPCLFIYTIVYIYSSQTSNLSLPLLFPLETVNLFARFVCHQSVFGWKVFFHPQHLGCLND